jgi:hypothetical protein
MTDEQQAETGELTERFRAFSQTVDPEPSRAFPLALVALAVLALAVLVTMVVVVFG